MQGSCVTKRMQDKKLIKDVACHTISALIIIQRSVLPEAVSDHCGGQPRRLRNYGNSTVVFRTQRFPLNSLYRGVRTHSRNLVGDRRFCRQNQWYLSKDLENMDAQKNFQKRLRLLGSLQQMLSIIPVLAIKAVLAQ